MKRIKKSKPKAEPVIPAIDADVLARINEKIAKAHEQNERPYVYHKPMRAPNKE